MIDLYNPQDLLFDTKSLLMSFPFNFINYGY